MNAAADFAGSIALSDWRGRLGLAVDPARGQRHAVYYEPKPAMNDGVDRAGLLSDGQRDCLRLVYAHLTSKDIARALDISPHTVDMRLRTAMKTLGVASRIEAARALADYERADGAYQPLIYQAPDVAAAADTTTVGEPTSTASDEYATQHSDPQFRPAFGPSAGGPPRPAGAPLPSRNDTGIAWERQDEQGRRTPLAGSVPWGSRNTLTPGARLAWIAAIAIGSALGFGAILGALEALKNLL